MALYDPRKGLRKGIILCKNEQERFALARIQSYKVKHGSYCLEINNSKS